MSCLTSAPKARRLNGGDSVAKQRRRARDINQHPRDAARARWRVFTQDAVQDPYPAIWSVDGISRIVAHAQTRADCYADCRMDARAQGKLEREVVFGGPASARARRTGTARCPDPA